MLYKYVYTGECEVVVPDLAGHVVEREHEGHIQPGETFTADVELNNPIFTLARAAAPVKVVPAAPPAEEAI